MSNYASFSEYRILHYLSDLGNKLNALDLQRAIEVKMNNGFTNQAITQILGTVPSYQAKESCYQAYI